MINLKSIARKVAVIAVANDFAWGALSKTLVRASQFLCAMRNNHEADEIVANHPPLREALAKMTILAGPFSGMGYGDTKAMCSALYPKLLGTYEHELNAAFVAALQKNHALVVDIGAADGYYAVGFAFKNATTHVIAFDQDPRARIELAKLASLNEVSTRIDIRERCDSGDLAEFQRKSGLMIVDCEGFEDLLLTEENIAMLKNWNFIIETHDGFSPDVTKRLKKRFASTHDVETIEAIHDFDKLDHVNVPLLEGLPRRQADLILREGREHACLRWLVCSPLG